MLPILSEKFWIEIFCYSLWQRYNRWSGRKSKIFGLNDSYSKSKTTNVQISLDFANVMTNTTFLHTNQVDIESAINWDKPWVNVEDIGIKQMHVIKCNLQSKKMQLWKTNCSNVIPDIEVNCISTKSCKSIHLKLSISNFNISNWCTII